MGRSTDTHKAVDQSDLAQEAPGALYLIATMADATWRMFVPTIGLLLLGNYLDDQLHSTPWLMLVGVVVGAGISALLIRRLMRGKRRS
jgi:hypothetical protein